MLSAPLFQPKLGDDWIDAGAPDEAGIAGHIRQPTLLKAQFVMTNSTPFANRLSKRNLNKPPCKG